jgi:hypothetical protein
MSMTLVANDKVAKLYFPHCKDAILLEDDQASCLQLLGQCEGGVSDTREGLSDDEAIQLTKTKSRPAS